MDPVDLFDPYVSQPGQDCYLEGAEPWVPTMYCMGIMYVWAVGGRVSRLT